MKILRHGGVEYLQLQCNFYFNVIFISIFYMLQKSRGANYMKNRFLNVNFIKKILLR